ncbi:hypothetical protein BCR33DRAFT_722546, partial [Rhizoclosmatium globosum]
VVLLFYNGDNGGGSNGSFANLIPAMINLHANENWKAYNATLKPADAFPPDAKCGVNGNPACMVGYGKYQIPQVAFSLLQTALTQFTAALQALWTNILVLDNCHVITMHFAFVFVNLHTTHWAIAVGMLMFTQVCYQMTLSFFFAAFPRLACHMPSVYDKIDRGCTVREVDEEIAIQRGRISMVSTYWSNIGWAVPLLIFTGVIFALNPDPDAAQVDFTYNANALVYGVYWLVFAIPYFILDKRRPGPPIPEGVNIYTQGITEAREAIKLSKFLPQAWRYIIGYFLFTDGLNASGVILQNYIQPNYLNYNVLKTNLLSLAQAVASMLGCLVFWQVQLWFKIETKTMLQVSNVLMMLTYAWGIVGLFSTSIGYRSLGIPFFGLFGIMTKCSAFIGPLVNFIITTVSPSQEADYIGFVPCTILSLIGFIIMQCTDPVRGRRDVIAYEQREYEEEYAARRATL